MIENLLKWNEAPQRNDCNLDYAFGLSVLLSLVPEDSITAGEIDQCAFDFILGNFFIFILHLLNCEKSSIDLFL